MNFIMSKGVVFRAISRPKSFDRGYITVGASLFKDLFHGGSAYFAGMGEGILTVAGKPARREIWLIALKNYRLIRRCWSEQDGSYFFAYLDPRQKYMLLARDYTAQYAPFAWDHLLPATEMSAREQKQHLQQQGWILVVPKDDGSEAL